MDKRFWAIIGVIIVAFAGLVLLRSGGTDNNGNTNAKPTNHVRGNLDSSVTLLEYGDYQCPACEGYFTTVEQVYDKYKDTVKFQFRNLPLTQIHQHAFAAARAAEAADLQGKFWEMYTKLYTANNWSEWTSSNNTQPLFEQYAGDLGLNADQFKKDAASSTVNNRIQADIAAFKKTGKDMATPTFFINGKFVPNSDLMVDGMPSVDAFSKVIDNALNNAGK